MRLLSRAPHILLLLLFALLSSCSLSSDKPLTWKTSVEVPIVASREFVMGRMIDTLFFGADQVSDSIWLDTIYGSNGRIAHIDTMRDTLMSIGNAYGDSTDVVTFSVSRHAEANSAISEKLFEETVDTELMGPLALTQVAAMAQLVPLADGPLDLALPIALHNVYFLRFMAGSRPLSVHFSNVGSGTLTGLQFGIAGLDTIGVGDLGPGGDTTVLLPCAGGSLDSVPLTMLAATVAGSSPGDTLGVTLSFAEAAADSVVLLDSLAAFSRSFVKGYTLSDSVDIDYIDIRFGFFYYHVVNKTSLRLHVVRRHRYLWIGDQCEIKGIQHWEDIDGSGLDSMYYAGRMPLRDIEPHFSFDYEQLSLSGTRLFPEWDADSGKCVSNVDYEITSLPRGERVSLTSTDTLIFSIGATSFKFDKFEGQVVKPWQRADDTAWVPVSMPFPASVTDSLRGRFVLGSAQAVISMTTGMPPGAQLDTFNLSMHLFDPASPGIVADTTAQFYNVHDDTTFTAGLAVSALVGRMPDSIGIISRTSVPVGTHMKVVNDLAVGDPDYATLIGRMTVSTSTRYRFDAQLDWAVSDSISLDLGRTDFDPGDIEFFRRLTERSASINLSIANNTNLPMTIYGLLCMQASVDSLDSLSFDSVMHYSRNVAAAEATGRYASLLGEAGVTIPPRGAAALESTIALDEYTLAKLIDEKGAAIRWFIRLPPMGRDRLSAADALTMSAWLHMEGLTSADAVVKPW